MLGVLGVLNVLNALYVLNVLNVLNGLNMDASLACWALFHECCRKLVHKSLFTLH